MDILDPTLTISLGTIVAISGLIYTWIKILKNLKKSKEDQEAKILQAAKEADEAVKRHFEDQIEAIRVELTNLEQNVGKDIGHLKEIYSAEIKGLGSKIEDLRKELHENHSQMLNLLTKLIDSSK